MLGIEVYYKKSDIILHQKKFVADLLNEYNCTDVYEVVSFFGYNSQAAFRPW